MGSFICDISSASGGPDPGSFVSEEGAFEQAASASIGIMSVAHSAADRDDLRKVIFCSPVSAPQRRWMEHEPDRQGCANFGQ
jgi:hypothetical protein